MNPRYRPPSSRPPGFSPGVVSRLRALQHASAQITQRGTGAYGASFWELSAGEQLANQDGYQGSLIGTNDEGTAAVQEARFDLVKKPWRATLGDVPVVTFERFAAIHGLRGVAVRGANRGDSSAWYVLGGVPTPRPGNPARRLGLGGVAWEGWRYDGASFALALLGFGRGRVARVSAIEGDTLAGRGASVSFGSSLPLGLGELSLRLGAQTHTLPGHRVLAALQRAEWSCRSAQSIVAISDERASAHARIPDADHFAAAPRREDRWNAQTRFAGGSAELHTVGVMRAGGDPLLDANTIGFGGSRSWRSGWHAGSSFNWDRRAPDGVNERRLTLNGGRVGRNGIAALGRFDLGADDLGRRTAMLTGETSVPVRGGLRLTFEPRFTWNDRRFERAQTTSSLGCALPGSGSLIATLAIGMSREDGFTPALQELSLAVSFTPRERDNADFEVRRLSGDGTIGHEVSASYDLQAARYENIGGWLSARDSGRVLVQVVRSGNRTGVRDVLVSLDGKSFRFTDAHGIARFEDISPGVHVVAVEEGSLPEAYRVVNSSRAFVTIERGRPVDPVFFEIARPARVRTF